ncbi:MAG: hypothetical protein ACI9XK_004494 [Granulosicoccus sp.]
MKGHLSVYTLQRSPVERTRLIGDRIVFSAARVVRDPYATDNAAIDWEKTMAFRAHLVDLGLGIAESMDTAQRGAGLEWSGVLELIRQTKMTFPNALVANGCGTDQLDPSEANIPR